MNKVNRNYSTIQFIVRWRFLQLMVLLLSVSNSLTAQEFTNLYVTYTPSGNGYVIEMNFDWKFSDCSIGNSINLGIKFNPAKSSSTVYIYEGTRYTLATIGAKANIAGNVRGIDLVGDVFDGSYRLGRIDMKTVTPYAPSCLQFSYSVTEPLGLSYKDYKDHIKNFNLMNVQVIDAATTDLDVEKKIKEIIKKNTTEGKIVIADKLFAIERYEEAKKQYEEIINIEPTNKHAKNKLEQISKMEVEKEIEPLIANADSKFSGQQYSEAEKLYNEVLTKDAENQHAKSKLEEISKINESNANLEQIKQHIKDGDAYVKSKEYQKAIDEFTAALNLKPSSEDQAYLQEHIARIEKMKPETEDDDQLASNDDEAEDDFWSGGEEKEEEKKSDSIAEDDFWSGKEIAEKVEDKEEDDFWNGAEEKVEDDFWSGKSAEKGILTTTKSSEKGDCDLEIVDGEYEYRKGVNLKERGTNELLFPDDEYMDFRKDQIFYVATKISFDGRNIHTDGYSLLDNCGAILIEGANDISISEDKEEILVSYLLSEVLVKKVRAKLVNVYLSKYKYSYKEVTYDYKLNIIHTEYNESTAVY